MYEVLISHEAEKHPFFIFADPQLDFFRRLIKNLPWSILVRWMSVEANEEGIMPTRKDAVINGHRNSNRVKLQRLSCIFQENRWHVIRTENGRSGSHADLSKHC
jgi:hypothetical protein